MFKKSSDYKGRILDGEELVQFHTLGVGQKLGKIRDILEEEYGEEFSRNRIARKSGITHQGLYFLEVKSKRTPRDNTLRKLLQLYNIPLKLLEERPDQSNRRLKFDHQPVFIGKLEDQAMYLKDQEEQQKTTWDSINNFVPTGNDLLEVELNLIAFIPGTPFIHRDELAGRAKLTMEDIQLIKELVFTQIELIASRREALRQLQLEQQ